MSNKNWCELGARGQASSAVPSVTHHVDLGPIEKRLKEVHAHAEASLLSTAELASWVDEVHTDVKSFGSLIPGIDDKLKAVYLAMNEVMKKSLLDQTTLRSDFKTELSAVRNELLVRGVAQVKDLAINFDTHKNWAQGEFKVAHTLIENLVADVTHLREIVEALTKPAPAPVAPVVVPPTVEVVTTSASKWPAFLLLILLILVGVGYAYWQHSGV